MKSLTVGLALLLGFGSQWSSQAEEVRYALDLYVGSRLLDDEWDPVEEQDQFGLLLQLNVADWPVGIEVSAFAAEAEATAFNAEGERGTFEGTSQELDLGARKTWLIGDSWQWYVSGGVALIQVELSLDAPSLRASDDDEAVGVWLGGGGSWLLGEHLSLGFDLRGSSADVYIDGEALDAGAGSLGFFVGCRW